VPPPPVQKTGRHTQKTGENHKQALGGAEKERRGGSTPERRGAGGEKPEKEGTSQKTKSAGRRAENQHTLRIAELRATTEALYQTLSFLKDAMERGMSAEQAKERLLTLSRRTRPPRDSARITGG